MDWKYFLLGAGFLAIGYWCYRDVKGTSMIDKEDGVPQDEFVRGWGAVILFGLAGLIFIVMSFS